MARLFTDEDFPYPVVPLRRQHNHDVLTTLEAGLAGIGTKDEAILEYAYKLNRTVITLNRRDFVRLHMQNSDHSGIVVCSYDHHFEALADRIHKALEASPELRGMLLRVYLPNVNAK